MTDLDDPDRIPPDMAGQADAIRACALDAECIDDAERSRPRDQLGIAGTIGGDATVGETDAQGRDRHGDMHVLVCVNADDHGRHRIDGYAGLRHVADLFTAATRGSSERTGL